MAVLNLSNPQHPTFSYQSGGLTVSGGVECNCPEPPTQACLDRCHAAAQRDLDASLSVLPED